MNERNYIAVSMIIALLAVIIALSGCMSAKRSYKKDFTIFKGNDGIWRLYPKRGIIYHPAVWDNTDTMRLKFMDTTGLIIYCVLTDSIEYYKP